jgi:hypothetical protein
VAMPPRIAPGREDPVMDEWLRTCAFIIGEITTGQARKGFRINLFVRCQLGNVAQGNVFTS